MATLTAIERMFSIKLTPTSHRFYEYDKELTLDQVTKVIADNPKELSWQDPARPDCGNDDGIMYVLLQEEDDCEVFLCFDPSDRSFSFC